MSKDWTGYFLLSRPYTLPSIVLVAVLASVFAREKLVLDGLFTVSVVFSLAVWGSMVYLNEVFKTKPGRKKIVAIIPAIFFLMALVIAIFTNYLVIPLMFLALLSTLLYKLKALDWFGSSFMFMFRGFIEVAIFFSVILFYSVPITNEILSFALILFLVVNSRNLVGDLRDIGYDKYTFTKKYGTYLSNIFSILLLIISIILMPLISVFFPLLVMIALLLVSRDGYFLHHVFVISSIFYLFNYLSYLLVIDLFITNFIYISTMLSLTYKFVPRKANPKNNLHY